MVQQIKKNKEKLISFKSIVSMIGFGGLVGGYAMWVWMFTYAYLNGGSTVLDINFRNEMHIELIMNLILLPCVVIYVYWKLFPKKTSMDKSSGVDEK